MRLQVPVKIFFVYALLTIFSSLGFGPAQDGPIITPARFSDFCCLIVSHGPQVFSEHAPNRPGVVSNASQQLST